MGIFGRNFLRGTFWEKFLEKKFRGGFFRRTIFGRINFGRKYLGGIICLHYQHSQIKKIQGKNDGVQTFFMLKFLDGQALNK